MLKQKKEEGEKRLAQSRTAALLGVLDKDRPFTSPGRHGKHAEAAEKKKIATRRRCKPTSPSRGRRKGRSQRDPD